jgi:hypothetical protein
MLIVPAQQTQKLLAIAQPAGGGAPHDPAVATAPGGFQPRDGLDEAGRRQLERLVSP